LEGGREPSSASYSYEAIPDAVNIEMAAGLLYREALVSISVTNTSLSTFL